VRPLSAGAYGAGVVLLALSVWAVRRAPKALVLLAPLGAAAVAAAWGLDAWSQWQAGIRGPESAYTASVYALMSLQGLIAAVLLVMALFTAARAAIGWVDARRRANFDCLALFWAYAVGQGLAALALVRLWPELA